MTKVMICNILCLCRNAFSFFFLDSFCHHQFHKSTVSQKKLVNLHTKFSKNDLQHANYFNYIDYYLRHISFLTYVQCKMFTNSVFSSLCVFLSVPSSGLLLLLLLLCLMKKKPMNQNYQKQH